MLVLLHSVALLVFDYGSRCMDGHLYLGMVGCVNDLGHGYQHNVYIVLHIRTLSLSNALISVLERIFSNPHLSKNGNS